MESKSIRLRDINFNQIRDHGFIGLILRVNGKHLDEGFIGEVLNRSVHLADCEVVEQRPFFNEWVVELKEEEKKLSTNSAL